MSKIIIFKNTPLGRRLSGFEFQQVPENDIRERILRLERHISRVIASEPMPFIETAAEAEESKCNEVAVSKAEKDYLELALGFKTPVWCLGVPTKTKTFAPEGFWIAIEDSAYFKVSKSRDYLVDHYKNNKYYRDITVIG